MEALSRTKPHHLIMALPSPSPKGSAAEKPVALLTSHWSHREG